MKSVSPDELNALSGRKLEKTDRFKFKCHDGLDCFNLCCRNLNLFLYPYDVIRLKNHLGITSGEFIDRHTDMVLREGSFFPDVLLKMADNEEQTCPYLTSQGCSVYLDRPDSCRTFPVEQGLLYSDTGKPEPVFFFKPPDFCQGKNEDQELTIESWADDQDAQKYNTMTARWSEVKALFINNPFGPEGPRGNGGKMAFMAAYNVDAFRDFVFGSSFLKRYKVKDAVRKKIRRSDAEMMSFGFDFIKLTFFGFPSQRLRAK